MDPRRALGPLAAVLIGGAGVGLLAAYDAMTTRGVVSGVFVLVVAGWWLARFLGPDSTLSWEFVRLTLAFRLVMAFLYIGVVAWFYGGNADYVGYQTAGEEFVDGLFAGELRFLGKIPGGLIVLFGLIYVLVGASAVGMFTVSALLGFLGAYLVYRAAEIALPDGRSDRKFLAVMLFMMPSFAMWTSVLGKESLMLFFIGLTAYSFANIVMTPRPVHYVGLLMGITGTMMTRSAVGAILVFATIAALGCRRARTSAGAFLRPVVVVLALGIAVPVFWRLTFFAIEDRFGSFGEQFTETGDVAGALESYHRGLAGDTKRPESGLGLQVEAPTGLGIIGFVPKGVFALFFRPFVFEAWNALSLAASLESTALFGVLLWRIHRLLHSAVMAPRNPFVAFCWIAGLLMAVMLSLGSNFGVMIRQRGMVLPFFFLLLSIVPAPRRERHRVARDAVTVP